MYKNDDMFKPEDWRNRWACQVTMVKYDEKQTITSIMTVVSMRKGYFKDAIDQQIGCGVRMYPGYEVYSVGVTG